MFFEPPTELMGARYCNIPWMDDSPYLLNQHEVMFIERVGCKAGIDKDGE